MLPRGFKRSLTIIVLAATLVSVWLKASPMDIVMSAVKEPATVTILPLGDSITVGFLSEDGNGYRLSLSNALARAGLPAFNCFFLPGRASASQRSCRPPLGRLRGHRFVGSQAAGNMLSNRHEAYNGFSVSQIRAISAPVLQSYCGGASDEDEGSGFVRRPWDRPDAVLVMAGTNDVVRNPLGEDTKLAPRRLEALVDAVTRECPQAAVLLAKIVPSNDTQNAGVKGGAARVSAFNAALPALVAKFVARGHNVTLVDTGVAVSAGDLVDGVHPTDEAYVRMGQVWFDSLREVLPLLGGGPRPAQDDLL